MSDKPKVNDAFVKHLNNLIEYHKQNEEIHSDNKNYSQASYHMLKCGALKDLLIWIEIEEVNR